MEDEKLNFDSFRGRIKAYIGWFDENVKDIIEISDWSDGLLSKIRGKGGTNFENIFTYIEKSDFHNTIKSFVILTDGYGKFPQNYDNYDFDTIWVMTQDIKPPFGKLVKCEL